MAKSKFFQTDKTPWEMPQDLVIWLIVGFITAVIAHNISKEIKKNAT